MMKDTKEKTAIAPEEGADAALETKEAAPEATQEAAPKEEAEPAGKKPRKGVKMPDFLAPYVKAYPANRTFHVTADKMVFLAGDRGLAEVHQKSLKEGKVTTYNV